MSMKIIKITESDISRLIKRIISEQDDLEPDASDFGGPKFEGSKEFSFEIPILDKTFILEVKATAKVTHLALNKKLVPPGTFIPEDIMLIENLGEERYKLIRIMKEDIKYENYLLLIQQNKNLIEAV